MSFLSGILNVVNKVAASPLVKSVATEAVKSIASNVFATPKPQAIAQAPNENKPSIASSVMQNTPVYAGFTPSQPLTVSNVTSGYAASPSAVMTWVKQNLIIAVPIVLAFLYLVYKFIKKR